MGRRSWLWTLGSLLSPQARFYRRWLTIGIILGGAVGVVAGKAWAVAEAPTPQVHLTKHGPVIISTPPPTIPTATDPIIISVVPTPDTAGPCLTRPLDVPIAQPYGGQWGHPGVDLLADYGTPILACRSGTVTMAGWNGGYGYAVVIYHGDGMETLYGHQSQISVSVGDHVNASQQIGLVGSTGQSTGNHVHFEVHLSDQRTDPAPYLPPTSAELAQQQWASLVALATKIGRCEQPGNGQYGINWTADGYTSSGHFAGGLGISVSLYTQYSGGHYAPADSPDEQIRVFGIIWGVFGQRAWGCPA